MGVRLLLRPAPEDWSRRWQKRMQARRDGDDRDPRAATPSTPSPYRNFDMNSSIMLSLFGLVGFLGFNWYMWQQGNIPELVLLNLGLLTVGGGGLYLWRRMFAQKSRPYLDEVSIEEKLKSWDPMPNSRLSGFTATWTTRMWPGRACSK